MLNNIIIPAPLRQTFSATNPQWIDQISCQYTNACNESHFMVDRVEPKSRFGLIVYGTFCGEKAVLKLLPQNLLKSISEMTFFEVPTYSSMIPIYELNKSAWYYIMARGNELDAVSSYRKRFEMLASFFEEIYVQELCIKTGLQRYSDKLHNRCIMLNNNDTIIGYLKDAFSMYLHLSSTKKESAIHGDIRTPNIILLDNQLKLIDPIGLIGIKELEFSRYIEDEIYNCENYVEFYEIFDSLLLNFNSLGVDSYTLAMVTYIDSVLRTSSSVLMQEPTQFVVKGLNNAIWLKRYLDLRR